MAKPEQPAVPKEHTHHTGGVAAIAGGIAGAVVGSAAGPAGVVAGMVVGTVAGSVVGGGMEIDEERVVDHDKELDAAGASPRAVEVEDESSPDWPMKHFDPAS